MPVSARVVRMAVRIRVRGSSPGFGPSSAGDHGPPIAIGSLFPFNPTCSGRTTVFHFVHAHTRSTSCSDRVSLCPYSQPTGMKNAPPTEPTKDEHDSRFDSDN